MIEKFFSKVMGVVVQENPVARFTKPKKDMSLGKFWTENIYSFFNLYTLNSPTSIFQRCGVSISSYPYKPPIL